MKESVGANFKCEVLLKRNGKIIDRRVEKSALETAIEEGVKLGIQDFLKELKGESDGGKS